jgi:hypothetical protein
VPNNLFKQAGINNEADELFDPKKNFKSGYRTAMLKTWV